MLHEMVTANIYYACYHAFVKVKNYKELQVASFAVS